jgi:hypothetical protein
MVVTMRKHAVSFDDKNLSCQVTNPAWGQQCDQIFNFDIARAAKDTTYRPPLVSTGKGARPVHSFYRMASISSTP